MGVNKQGKSVRALGEMSKGFTVVEVVLFLAITALLAVLLLGGWTAMINSQRYKDSTRTFQSFLQQQYNLTYNVENGISDATCTPGDDGIEIEADTGTQVARGQSNCVLMGRYVLIQDGVNVQVRSIVGIDQSEDESPSDIESIRLYEPYGVDAQLGLTDNEFEIPWQAAVVGTAEDPSSNAKDYAIAIIRAPLTGTVHTFVYDFTDESSTPEVIDVVNADYEDSRVDLCLDPGVALAGGRLGVTIDPYASSQSAIRLITSSESVC